MSQETTKRDPERNHEKPPSENEHLHPAAETTRLEIAVNRANIAGMAVALASDMRFLLWVLYLLANWLGLIPAWAAPTAAQAAREIRPGVYSFIGADMHTVVSGDVVAVIRRGAQMGFGSGDSAFVVICGRAMCGDSVQHNPANHDESLRH